MAIWNRKRQKPRRVERLRAEGDISWYERLTHRHVRWQVVILAAWVAGAVLLMQLPRPPLPYRKGETSTHPILSRVDFEYIDHQVTADVRELTALLRVPGLYTPNARPAIALRESLLALLNEIAKAETPDAVPRASRDAWNLDAEMFASVKETLGQSGTALADVSKTITEATSLLADPTNLPIVREEDFQRAQARIANFRELRKQLPAGLAPETAPILEEPSAVIVVQLAEGDQELPLGEKVLTVPQTDRIQSRIKRLIDPLLQKPFGRAGVGLLAVGMAPKVGPTLLYDQAKTENERAEVRSKVQPVPILRKKGTTLVEAGKQITEADIEILEQEQEAYLEDLGYTRQILAWAGAVVLTTALVLILAGYTAQFQPRVARSVPRGLMLALLGLLVLALAKAVGQTQGPSTGALATATFVVATAGMIVTIAYNQAFALGTAWGLTLLIALANRTGLDWALVTIAGNGIAILSLGEVNNRSKLIKVGALAGLVFFLAHTALAFWRLSPPELDLAAVAQTILWPAVLYSAAGVAAGIVMLAILPFIERMFGIVTNISLLELCDVNQPALKRLALEAPGTYAHSLLIGTLSQAAAEAIGASGLLARVGAYFHDIGKANKPRYFVENLQNGEKPHDRLTPAMSRLIISSHVKDGQEMADRLGLPPMIRDFIAEHHGTTLMAYFYDQACRQAEGTGQDPPDENDFRYPGPKPRRPETAIVMLADAVEGATRSLKDRTAGKIKAAVHDMVMKRLLDGQLDDSGLTMNDLTRIEEALTKTLLSVYHGRIQYPGQAEAAEAQEAAEAGKAEPPAPRGEQSADMNRAGPGPDEPTPQPSAAPADEPKT
jgi:putative nucleotidyltransferase with HDIG domain